MADKSLKERILSADEEPEDWRVEARRKLKEQEAKAEEQTKRLEEKKLADKVKIADAFELSPEERNTYLSREMGGDSLKSRVTQPDTDKPFTPPATPLVMAPKEDPATPTMDNTVVESIDDNSGYGAEVKKAFGQVNSLLSQANKIPAHDRTFFKERVKEAQDLFKEAENKLEKRELAEKLGHALTQLGAGMHGLKTGTDMSGLKFDKADWDRRLEMQLGKFRDALDAARDEDRMALADKQAKQSSLVSQAGVAASVAGSLAAADSRTQAIEASKEKAGLKAEKAQRDTYIKRKGEWDKFQSSLKNAKNLDPDITVSQLRSRALSLAGPEHAGNIDKLIKDAKGWGGLDEADAKDAAAAINDYIATLPEPTFSSAPTGGASGEVEGLDKKTGKVAIFDAETKKFKRWK